MKKIVSTILASTLLLGSVSTTAMAQEVTFSEPYIATLSSPTLSVDAAKAYLALIDDTSQKYGVSTAQTQSQTATKGVYRTQLLDLDGDGTLELLIAYVSDITLHSNALEYLSGAIEVWTYTGTEALMLGKISTSRNHSPFFGTSFVLEQTDSAWAIVANERTILVGQGVLDYGIQHTKVGTELVEEGNPNLWDDSWNKYDGKDENIIMVSHENISYLFLSCEAQLETLANTPESTSPQYDTWATGIVATAEENQLIVKGLGIDYTRAISRLQIAELLVNMIEKYTGTTLESASSGTFTDTSDSSVLKAYSAGLISGKGNQKFDPNATATRQELALMFYNSVKKMEEISGKSLIDHSLTTVSGFIDFQETATWAQSAMAIMVNGSILGGNNGKLHPEGTATIQEALVMNNNLFQLG